MINNMLGQNSELLEQVATRMAWETLKRQPDMVEEFGIDPVMLKIIQQTSYIDFDRLNPQIILGFIQNFDPNQDFDFRAYRHADKIIWDKKSKRVGLHIHFGEDVFSIASPNLEFHYTADLTIPSGHLDLSSTLVISSKLGFTRRYDPMPRFNELFDSTISYFAKLGTPVREVAGAWNAKWEGQKNTNYYTYIDGIKKGLSREEAALQTPTGKSAKRHGFNIVEIVSENRRGKYAGVDVNFKMS